MQTDVSKTAKSILGLIADCGYRTRYPSANRPGGPSPLAELFEKARQLYETDPTAFDTASARLMSKDSEWAEEDLIRLECAGMYGSDSVRTYILRLRFALGLGSEADERRTADMITDAFSARTASPAEQCDRQNPWKRLIEAVLKRERPEDAALADALTRILTPALFPGVDGAVAYTLLCKSVKQLGRPGTRMKTVALAVTSLAVIEGDGLAAWAEEYGLRAVSRLSAALDSLGLPDAAAVLRELDARMRSGCDEVPETFADRLRASCTDEELNERAEKYLTAPRK